ncbi:MAG: MFS transporter [Leptotrichiaceae bacterium]|nr:MFS transporter [Leptotrichiaceae bacterium]
MDADIQQQIKKTKKYSIFEAVFYNGFYVGMQGFVMLSLAIYFNFNPFFISIVSVLPTAGYFLQIFTKSVNRFLGNRKKTLMMSVTISRMVVCVLPFAVLFDIRKPEIYFLIMFIYALFSPFVNNVWTATMVEIIEKKDRGRYFGLRNLFSSLSTVVYILLYGYLLSMNNKKVAMLLLTSCMSISAIGSAVFMCLHYVPILGKKIEKVSIRSALKNKNFVIYLKFASVWLFTWEFLKPLFEYYRIKILGVDIIFISQMGVLTAILSSGLYVLYGKLSDKYGNKTMLRMGIFFTTYFVLIYYSMTEDNKISMLFTAAIVDAVGFTAITLSLLNLLMEIAEEPADAYVGAYAAVCGMTAISAGIFGGVLGTYINNGVVYIFGETFHTIRIAFVIGFLLRLYCLLQLTRVDSFEKTFVYKGGLPIKNILSKRLFSIGATYINATKAKINGHHKEEVEDEKRGNSGADAEISNENPENTTENGKNNEKSSTEENIKENNIKTESEREEI